MERRERARTAMTHLKAATNPLRADTISLEYYADDTSL